ncbi:SapC family protein [Paenalcaligenes faecalis]|uniref:SapC family protein n=1 Tax=Paenalcaligenes faecalis TaxID=2980099 RepID=UPI0022B99113|nr:SapC family protein [Paenalcaligenes faecalis]
MPPSFTALSPSQHKLHGWLPREAYHFAKDEKIAPILLAELSHALPHYLLGFVQQGEQFQLVALLTLGGKNLYLNVDGKWLGDYVPAAFRGFPFAFAVGNTADERILCINDAHLSTGPEAQPLFNTDGTPSQALVEMQEFLLQTDNNRTATQAAVNALSEAGLLMEWELIIPQTKEPTEDQTRQPVNIEGMYRIDEAKLAQIDAETFSRLMQTGAMPMAYAQLFSMQQANQLTMRAEYAANHEGLDEVDDMDELFGEKEETIRFDFN